MTRRVSLPLVAAACTVVLSACGSGAGPTSVPTPSPSPGPLAIVADRAAGTLVTLAVNPETGGLTRISSLTVTKAEVWAPIAADPRGRFVYLAYGNELRSYGVDHTSGQLTERSRVESGFGSASWVAASERQVYGIFQVSKSGFGSTPHWRGYSVDASTGVSGGPLVLPWHSDLSMVVPDPAGGFVYTDGIGAFFVSSVQLDGSVVDVENVDLPVGWPLCAAIGPGFIAVTDDYGNLLTAAIDSASGRVAPRALATEVFGNAYLGNMNTPQIAVAPTGLIGLLGVRTQWSPGSPVPWSLQTWHVDATGNLARRAETHFPEDVARHVAFDPSGRFVYVAGRSDGIHAFAVATDGGLRAIGNYAFGTGPIVMIPR